MLEKSFPWWRRVLNYALGGIRSGFGLFSRPATPAPIPDETRHTLIEPLDESLEKEEIALTEIPTNPQIVADVPAAESASVTAMPLAEPIPSVEPEKAEEVAVLPAEQPLETAEPQVEEVAEPVAETPQETPADDPSEEASEEPLQTFEPVVVEEAAESVTEETSEEFAEDPAAELAEVPVEELLETVEPSVEEAEEPVAETPQEKVGEDPSEAASVEPADETADVLAEEPLQTFEPIMVEEATEPVTEETSEEFAEYPSDDLTEVPVVDSLEVDGIEVQAVVAPAVDDTPDAIAVELTDGTVERTNEERIVDTAEVSHSVRGMSFISYINTTESTGYSAPEGEVSTDSSDGGDLLGSSDVAPAMEPAASQESETPSSPEAAVAQAVEPVQVEAVALPELAAQGPIPQPEREVAAQADAIAPGQIADTAPAETPDQVVPAEETSAVPAADIAQRAPEQDSASLAGIEPTSEASSLPQLEEASTQVPLAQSSASNPMGPEEPAAAQRANPKESAPPQVVVLKSHDDQADLSPFSIIVDQVYDGPLDLLLDLIRKQDIDIYDIPIAKITFQFLAYVNQLKAGDVDVAGEFIYIASLLIHIKSKMLLPRAAAGPDDAAEDPRRELVERLLEHERFKNAAQMLQQKQMLEAATWSNPGIAEFKDDDAAEPEIAADTVDLVRIFRDILERARKRPVINIEEESATVGQMIRFLARRLTMEDKPIALRRLLSHTRSERALISMFLALLELVRLQAVLLRQDRSFSEIFIKKHTGFDAVMNDGLANARDDWR